MKIKCSVCKREGVNGFITKHVDGVLTDFCPDCRGRRVLDRIDGSLNSLNEKRFMYRDRDWEKDIKSRKMLPDGSIGRFKDGKRLD